MTLLRTFYKKGRVTKEKLLAAMLAYQAAVDATKSVERDAADVANAREIARAKELGIDLDAEVVCSTEFVYSVAKRQTRVVKLMW